MAVCMATIEWRDDTTLAVDGTVFTLAPTEPVAGRPATSGDEAFVLRKPPWMVEAYERLAAEVPAPNAVELGIDQGGSTALLSLLFAPTRLVAVDVVPEPVAALDTFLTAHRIGDRVHAYWGVDQADATRLGGIVDDEFGTTPLDVVIDDASHLFRESTASFNLLFPRLRPGGLYILEDWSCAHVRDEAVEAILSSPAARAALEASLAAGETPPRPRAPMSLLLLELVLTAGYASEVVAEILAVRPGWAVVRRGPAELDPATFDIATVYGSLGRRVLANEITR